MNEKRVARNKNLFIIFIILFALTFTFSCRPKATKVPEPPRNRHQPYNFEGKNGMVVAAHPLAAEAGLEILKNGGNAVDAAVGTSFALNAAEPFASGIGGGGFMVIYLAKEEKATVINYREKASARAAPNMFMDGGKTNEKWRREHGLAVAVPGALAGWSLALSKYGTKELADVMQRGIEIAEEGLSISKTFSKINKDQYEKILLNAGEANCYLNNGFPYEPGDLLRNPELANTFKLIASRGIQEFYKGEIARKIVKAVKDKGGILTLEDLALYKAKEQDPLKGTYRDYTLFSISPPSSGGLHIIQLLNIIENWPVKKWGHNSPDYIHHLSEAFRFVFADRARYLGDPDFISIPVQEIIAKKYATQIVSQIKSGKILGVYPYGEFDERENDKESTSHICVIDKEGNIVSMTQSINHFFGSGIIPENTGFLLNNIMDDFSRDTNSPNASRPSRQPVSSMAPLIMFKGKEPFLVLGSPGGTRIFTSLTQIVINVLEFGMSLDEAIEAPRFFTYSSQGKPRSISVESRILQITIDALEKIGNEIRVREAYDKYFGGAQGIMIIKRNELLHGGADSRRDGFGAGY